MRLLLLPGLDGTGKLFDDLIAAIPAGHGASPVSYPEALREFDEFVRYAESAIRDGGDTVLVAESFSGPVAVEIMRNPPRNLKAVVLVATFVQAPSPRLMAFTRSVPAVLMRAFSGLALDWFCLNGKEQEKTTRRIKQIVQTLSPRLIKARLKVLLSLPRDLPMVLEKNKLPVLFLKPIRDRLVPEKYFGQIEQRLPPESTVQILGPHFLLQCCPQDCAKAISEFVRRLA